MEQDKKDKLNVELSTIILYEESDVKKVRKMLEIIEREKKEVFDDIEKLNNHPLKKDGCFHTELIRSDIDKLKHHHLKKEDEGVAR